MVAGLLGALALAVALVVVAPGARRADEDLVDGDAASSPGDAASGPGREVPDLVPFADPAGEFEVDLPEAWVSIATRGDLEDAGAQALPDDPDEAAAFDRFLLSLPRPVVAVSTDPTTLGDRFVVNLNLVRVSADPTMDEVDEIVEATPRLVASLGFEQVGAAERVELPAGDAVRIESRHDAQRIEVVQYYLVPHDDVAWTLTLNAPDLSEYEGVIEAVADTFVLTEGAGSAAAPEPSPAATTRVSSPDGSFAADLPAGWVTGFPGEGAPSLGQQMFPDNPDAASAMGMPEAALVTPQTRMVAADPVGWNGDVPPPDLVVADGVSGLDPGRMDIQEMADLAKPTGGTATLGAEGRIDGVSGEIAWFELSLDGFGFAGVRYVITGSDSVWLVTFWSADLGTTRSVGDAIAASFAPG
jgi:hypothetical protein